MNTCIKSLMKEYGINQKELASILGISASAISQWKECSTMNVDTLFALSKLFQVTIGELLTGNIEEKPEQKWERLYNLERYDSYGWELMLQYEDEEAMFDYLERLHNINNQFYKLLYKKMAGMATPNELSEIAPLQHYFRWDLSQSAYFYNKCFDRPTQERETWIYEILNEAVGIENEEAFVWELQRIYQNEKQISFKEVKKAYNDNLLYAWYNTLTQERKDRELTYWYFHKLFNNAVLYEFIKRGGRILYTNFDFPNTNYDRAELEKFEGTKTPLPKSDEIKKILIDNCGRGSGIPYQQYQALINEPAMESIEMERKFKKKNPIKYWEFIKQRRIQK